MYAIRSYYGLLEGARALANDFTVVGEVRGLGLRITSYNVCYTKLLRLMPDFTALCLALLAGVLLDRLLGEPSHWHPLVGFGRIAAALEARLNRKPHALAGGAFAWTLAVLPWVILAWAAHALGGLIAWGLDALLLYFALGARSLGEHRNNFV